MNNEFYKYYKYRDDEELYFLLPSVTKYENTIMAYATKENALVKAVRCDRISVGYANIYYTDYDLPKIFILMVK